MDFLSPEFIAIVTAAAGFFGGVWQYRVAQNWKRADVVLQLVDKFDDDPEAVEAGKILDSDEKEIEVVPEGSPAVTVPWANVNAALRNVPADKPAHFEEYENHIRMCFDSFFDFFDLLGELEKAKLLLYSDLQYFTYWLDLLLDDYRHFNRELPKILREYAKDNHFDGAVSLLEKHAKQRERARKKEKRTAASVA